ncbi:MAG: ysxE [Bacillales bacterium]|jgi:spore coat protein YsxE|nr:ysxE [Bacillales bacterium]
MPTDEKIIRDFLENYQLRLEFYEDVGRVKKVYTQNGVFCIKSIPALKGTDFVKNIHNLYQKGYNRIVPVFQTINGQYGVLVGNQLWYLMPWLPDEIKGESIDKHKQMVRELARMHILSVKERPVSKQERDNFYNKTKEKWERQKAFLDEYIVQVERKWYMSPFELQYAAYHEDMSRALTYSLGKFEEWNEKTKNDEKMRTVLTHGKVSIHHFVYSENGYGHFINLEGSREAAPHFDLLPFLVSQLRTFPKQPTELLELYELYLHHFPLREGEKLLFMSYLTNPENCVNVVEEFFYRRAAANNPAEIDFCQRLQTEYWLLKNTESMISTLESNAQQAQMAMMNSGEQNSAMT